MLDHSHVEKELSHVFTGQSIDIQLVNECIFFSPKKKDNILR